MVIHRSRGTHRLVVAAKARARIMVLAGQVMVVVLRMVGDRRVLILETMAVPLRIPAVAGPGMGVEPRMAGRRGIMVARRAGTVVLLVMRRSRRLGRGRGVLRMRTTCRMIMLPGRVAVEGSREVMFLMLLERNRILISRIRLTSGPVTGRVQRGVGTISIGLVLTPAILPNPEPTPHPTTIRVGIGVLMWMSIRVGIGVLMWMSIRVGIGVLMWMSIRVGIGIPTWMKILAGVSIPVMDVVTGLMVRMIIVTRMRVLVPAVMGRIMEGRVQETIR